MEYRNLGRRRPAPVQEDPASPLQERRVARLAFDANMVFPFVFVARMGEPIGKLAVVSEQDQPFAPQIQPPHREEMPRQRHQVAHRTPATVVLRHRKHSAWFVDGDVHMIRRNAHRPPVHGDRIACRVSFLPKLCHLTPDPYPSTTNQALTGSTGTEASAGQDLLQTLFHGQTPL